MRPNTVKRKLEDGFLLYLEKHGRDGLTIASLCRFCRVSTSSFYRNYLSLDELALSCMDGLFRGVFQKVTKTSPLTESLEVVFASLLQSKKPLSLLAEQHYLPLYQERFFAKTKQEILSLSLFHDDYQIGFFAGASWGFIETYLSQKDDGDPKALAESFLGCLKGYWKVEG